MGEPHSTHRGDIRPGEDRDLDFVCFISFFEIDLHVLCLVGLQVRMHAIRTAHENIDMTIKAADSILSQFDLARRVRSLLHMTQIMSTTVTSRETTFDPLRNLALVLIFFAPETRETFSTG